MEPVVAPGSDQPSLPGSTSSNSITNISLPHRPKPEEKYGPQDSVNGAEDTTGVSENSPVPPQATENQPAKKKPKKKSRGGKKKRATGFEEYYVDAPITPAEFVEEKKIYDLSKPAIQRLETSIQRYQAKRRMDEDRRNVFTKYMSYGGVDVSPKMFEGNDPRDLQDMDAEDIMTATAASNIPKGREGWLVDFERVAKGFFSAGLPQLAPLDTEHLVNISTQTIKNFLNYVLYHDVCPEYKDNIMDARKVCDKATPELWNAHQFNVSAPGDFNTAGSTLFGGVFFDSYTDDEEWSVNLGSSTVMPLDTARKVVKFAIAGAGNYQQALQFRNLASDGKLEAKCVHEDGFEVTAIIPPDSEVQDFYKLHAPDLKPVGKLQAVSWRDPGLAGEDFPPGEEPEDGSGRPPMHFEFFVEASLLKFCFVGMKVDSRVWELNCGIHYFEKVLAAYCSFYTVLPNESMFGWKEPRDLRHDDHVLIPRKDNGAESDDDDDDQD